MVFKVHPLLQASASGPEKNPGRRVFTLHGRLSAWPKSPEKNLHSAQPVRMNSEDVLPAPVHLWGLTPAAAACTDVWRWSLPLPVTLAITMTRFHNVYREEGSHCLPIKGL